MQQLRNIKINNHNQFYDIDFEKRPVQAKTLFDAIEHGPHFVFVCCLRCFFKDQVSSLTEKLKTKKNHF